MTNKNKSEKLIIGLPAGSLKEATLVLFRKAGFRISLEDRSYSPSIDDPEIECLLIRAQEIPIYVEQGVLDFGITGSDWIKERNAGVIELGELMYSKKGFNPVSLCLAAPENSPIKTIRDLNGKRIATELVNVTKKYLEKNLRALIDTLPLSSKPTVSGLSKKGWVALEAILEENEVKKLIPIFKKIGAEKIVEYPLNKIID